MLKLIINRLNKEASQIPIQGPCWSQSRAWWLVFWRHQQRKTTRQPHWRGPYQVLLTTDTVPEVGLEHWVHISQQKKTPFDSCSSIDTRDLRITLIRKRSTWIEVHCFLPRCQIKTSFFNSVWNPFSPSFSFLYSSTGLERQGPGHS